MSVIRPQALAEVNTQASYSDWSDCREVVHVAQSADQSAWTGSPTATYESRLRGLQIDAGVSCSLSALSRPAE